MGWRESDLICLMFLLLICVVLGEKKRKIAVHSSTLEGLNLGKYFFILYKNTFWLQCIYLDIQDLSLRYIYSYIYILFYIIIV